MPTTVKVKTLKINGIDVSGREDETILQVARENNIYIPTLCNLEGLTPIGACRLCIVEVIGSPKLLPACVTKVEEGMNVVTESDQLTKIRTQIMELIFSERNHVCAVCVFNNNCELQATAQKLGVDHIHFPYRYPKLSVDASHERFGCDHNRCILCTRCVRACHEVEGAHTWDIAGRGIEAKVVTDLARPWGESPTCTSCGKCVQVCPTGTLFEKGRSVAEQKKKPTFLPYLSIMRGEER